MNTTTLFQVPQLGVCTQDPDRWTTTPDDEAKTLCRACPRRWLCAKEAVEAPGAEGLWAGVVIPDSGRARAFALGQLRSLAERNGFAVRERTAGKRVVIFGLPGAFTPTCSARHVPGYVDEAREFFDAGIDEIWCVSVNDAFVMNAWGRDLQTSGKVKMIADGSARFTRALGLEQDLSERGMGIRSQRYAMVVDDSVVKTLNVEAPGKFEVSSAESVLATLS